MSNVGKVILLVGSPKAKNSTSESLGSYLLDQIVESGVGDKIETETIRIHSYLRSEEKIQDILSKVYEAELLLLAFPLYIDSLPWPVIRLLELISEHRPTTGQKMPKIAVICNCGFPESSQNVLAVQICQLFASGVGMDWLGGLALGGGGAIGGKSLTELGGLVRNVRTSLDIAALALAAGEVIPGEALELMAKALIPKWLYILIGNHNWKRTARKNGVKGELYNRPYVEQ